MLSPDVKGDLNFDSMFVKMIESLDFKNWSDLCVCLYPELDHRILMSTRLVVYTLCMVLSDFRIHRSYHHWLWSHESD